MLVKDTSCNIQRIELIICPDALSRISCKWQGTSLETRRVTTLVSHTVDSLVPYSELSSNYTSRTNQNEHESH
jgi:hypothetical protein